MKLLREEVVKYTLMLSSDELEHLFKVVTPHRNFELSIAETDFCKALHSRLKLEIQGG